MATGDRDSPILVILGSSRSRGNTRLLVDAAFQGARYRLVDLNEVSFSDYDYTHANCDDDFSSLADALAGRRLYVVATSTEASLPAGFEQTFRSTAEYLDMSWGGCLHVCFEQDLQLTPEAASAARRFGRYFGWAGLM